MTDFQEFLDIPSCGLTEKERSILKRRAEVITEIERYTGLPTLEYDDRIEALEYQAILLEKQILQTCDCCGGEVIPEGIILIHTPENGLCAQELEDCPLHLEATE